MDPVTGAALIGGGASLLGGLFGNKSAKKAAQRQEDFQREMANTVFQRGRKDLEAAGYNPMLGAITGVGAPSPAGAMPQLGDIVTPAVNSAKTALESRNLKMQNYVLETQGVSNDANAAKAMSDAALSAAQTAKVQAETAGTEFKNRGFDVLNHFLEPAAELIKGNNSAKSVISQESLRSPSGILPPPVFLGTSAQGRNNPKSNR